MTRKQRESLEGYGFLLPWLFGLLLLTLGPMVVSVGMSFQRWNMLTPPTPVGLANYRYALFRDPLFWKSLSNTATYAFLSVPLGMSVALGLAVLLNQRVRGLAFFRTVIFLPQVVAMVVIAVAWRRIYAPDGTVNQVLSAVGLESWTRGWLGEYAFALPAVGLVGTWFESGLVTVLLLAGMGRITRDLYEAARLDGAGPLREFFAVTLPSVRGEIAVALTLTVIAALKTFDLIYLTTAGGPGHQTTVPSYEVYRQAFELGRVGLACAIGVCLTVVIFAISVVITRVGDRAGD